ncbi:MAG: cytochrome c [Pseudobdellovibrionaceae bacterium]
MKAYSLMILPLLASGLIACQGSGNNTNLELIQDMMESPAVDPQEYDDFFEDKAGGARVPPEHTAPVGFKPYRAGFDPNLAKADRNPLAGDMSDEVLLVGQKYFNTNCMVCHGQKAAGNGTVAEKMPNKPPSLLSDKVRSWADGQIYQVITMGQGTMGPYASHIPQKYRWQVVNYIRHLQRTEK